MSRSSFFVLNEVIMQDLINEVIKLDNLTKEMEEKEKNKLEEQKKST